jgi:hypothetical protein
MHVDVLICLNHVAGTSVFRQHTAHLLVLVLSVAGLTRFNVVVCNYESNQQDALYRLIYYSNSALRVSGDVYAHHQEHFTVFTVSGSVHPSCCRLVSWMS